MHMRRRMSVVVASLTSSFEGKVWRIGGREMESESIDKLISSFGYVTVTVEISISKFQEVYVNALQL